MRYLLLILLFTEIGISAVTWVLSNMTCFNADTQLVTKQRSAEICRERGVVLHSVKNDLELVELKKILIQNSHYWVDVEKINGGFKWGDGRSCCPSSWWGQGEPNVGEMCARLYRPFDKVLLWGRECSLRYGFLCSKPAVYGWVRLDKNDYYLHDLCGVEILQNCKNPNCQSMCDSHHDCKQVAELNNICINIKNVSESDDCIVKLTPNLELFEKGWAC